jgi:hypothetical protein
MSQADDDSRYPDTPVCKRCIHKHCEVLLQLPRTPGKITFVHRSKFLFKCDYQWPGDDTPKAAPKEPEVLTDDLVVVSGKVDVTNPRWEHKDPDKKKSSPDKASVGDTIILSVDIKNFPDSATMTFDIYDTTQKPAQRIATTNGKNEKGIGKAEWKIEDKSSKGEKLELAFEGIARSKASEQKSITLTAVKSWGICQSKDGKPLSLREFTIYEGQKIVHSGKTDEKGAINAPFDFDTKYHLKMSGE